MFGYIGRCDIPLATVQSFFDDFFNKTHPDFILYLGDNPAHNTWQQEKDTHLRGLKEVTAEIKKRFKGPVYPVLGNHEGIPCDQFDFENPNTHSWIFKDSLEVWKDWFTPESRESYLKNGCYSQLFKDTKLRILALNPFVALNDNRYSWGNQTDLMGVVIKGA